MRRYISHGAASRNRSARGLSGQGHKPAPVFQGNLTARVAVNASLIQHSSDKQSTLLNWRSMSARTELRLVPAALRA